MSEANNTQTAVDATDVAAKPVTEGNDAQTGGDDLDTLLSQYDDSAKKPAATSTQPDTKSATVDNDLRSTLEEMKGYVSQAQAQQFRQDMDKTIKSVRGDLDPELFDDTLVESWLDAQARQDPRLQSAWNNRHTNPKQFEKVVDGLSRNFGKKYGKMPDKQATEDREAVTAAVRGASTRTPIGAPPDLSRLTDAQFAEAKEKMFG